MKILLVSDVECPALWDHFRPDRVEGVELIISCGDLKHEYLEFLVTMINKPLLYVPGNHRAGWNLRLKPLPTDLTGWSKSLTKGSTSPCLTGLPHNLAELPSQ